MEDSGRKIFIDDAMWGFPIGGMLMGIYQEDNRFEIIEIPVTYFQTPRFERKEYLDYIGEAVHNALKTFENIHDSKILICRGYCNNGVEKCLRKNGFKNVMRGVIGNPLQDYIENKAKEYIKNLGYPDYYDPKELTKAQIGKEFFKVVRWVKANNRYDIIKSGWNFWKNTTINI